MQKQSDKVLPTGWQNQSPSVIRRIQDSHRQSTPTLPRTLLIVWGALLLFFLLPTVAGAEDFPALDEAIQDSFVAHIAPVFDFDSDGCLPSAGISRDGTKNGGLNPTGSITGECRSSDFLETSNTLHRHACTVKEDSIYCGHFYALYFEKDQWGAAGGGHRHDWEHAIIWTTDGVVTHGSVSAHGGFDTKAAADIPFEGSHMKVVYHKDGLSTHALRFAKENESAENPYGSFVTPTLASWYILHGDSIDNATMRARLNDFDYGAANLDIKDGRFLDKLNEAKPAGFPQFTDEDLLAAQHYFLPVVNHDSWRCMDVTDKSQENDAAIIQSDCGSSVSQAWTLSAVDGTYHRLISQNSAKCLNVSGASQENGGLLVQWPCVGDDNELFQVEAVNDGDYRLRAKHSDRCVSLDTSPARGAQLVQWECNDAPSQRWTLPAPVPLVNRESGQCMDVEAGSQADGNAVIQFNCNNAPNQAWALSAVDGTYHRLISQNSAKCLNVKGASQEDGGELIQWPCVGDDNELFQVEAASAGYYRLRAKHSNRCVSLDTSAARGAQLVQWECNNAPSQEWSLPAPVSSLQRNFLFAVNQKSEQCMVVTGNSQADGAAVIQTSCDGSDHQTWTLSPAGDSYYKLIAKHSAKCLNVKGASQEDGGELIQWACGDADNERFQVERASDGYYRLRAKHSNHCVDVSDASQASGAQLIQSECTDSPSQRWAIQMSVPLVNQNSGQCMDVRGRSQADDAAVIQSHCDSSDNQGWTLSPVDGTYHRLIFKNSAKCLNVADASQEDGGELIQWPCSGADNELFQLDATSDGYYRLRAKHSNRCVDVSNASQMSGTQLIQSECTDSPSQRWALQMPVAIVNQHSEQCMDVQGRSREDGVAVNQFNCNGGYNQAWTLSPVDDTYYRLISKNSAKCLNVKGASQEDGGELIQWPCVGDDNELFQVEAASAGYYRLRAKHSDRCIDVSRASQASGAQLIQSECTDAPSQRWLTMSLVESLAQEPQIQNHKILLPLIVK